MVGNAPSAETIATVAHDAVGGLSLRVTHGSTTYRRRVGEAYVRRALVAAADDAGRAR
jgi:hypothetical protein